MVSVETSALIQAGAAVASLIVTAVLAILTYRYVKLTERLATEAAAQTSAIRESAELERREIAGVLMEEVNRIRSELGPAAKDGAAPVLGGSVPPSIHPWASEAIPRMARYRPDVVGAFMRLDRTLANFRVRMDDLREAREEKRRRRVQVEHDARGPYDPEPTAQQLAAALEADHRFGIAQENTRLARQDAATAHSAAHELLQDLEKQLDPLARSASVTVPDTVGRTPLAGTRKPPP